MMAEKGLPDLTIMAHVGHCIPGNDEDLFAHQAPGFEPSGCSTRAELH